MLHSYVSKIGCCGAFDVYTLCGKQEHSQASKRYYTGVDTLNGHRSEVSAGHKSSFVSAVMLDVETQVNSNLEVVGGRCPADA